MGVKHPSIIARGAFAWRMPFKILLGKIPKGWLMEPIVSHFCRIVAVRNRSHVGVSQLACLIHREWAIWPDREASHSPRMRFSKTKDFRPFVTRSAKPGSSVSRTNTWPADGKGVSSMACFVNRLILCVFT